MNARKTDTENPTPNDAVETDTSGSGAELSLEEQLQAALAERDANYDRLLRAQAEFENYRKRVQKESQEASRYQAMSMVRELLPALDNLGRAIAAADATDKEELVKGVQMVASQLDAILAGHAVEPIEAVGQPFDPNLHEAIQQLPNAEHPPMTVLDEVEKGYRLHDRVVRPSKVIVSREMPDDPSS